APLIISCIRFRIRRKVDLPQPDGPISAVTVPGSMARDTLSSTLWSPNQAEMLRAVRPDRGPSGTCLGLASLACAEDISRVSSSCVTEPPSGSGESGIIGFAPWDRVGV